MPKFSQLSERFQRIKAFWEDLGASSTSSSTPARGGGQANSTGFGSTHRLAPAGGSLRKYSNPTGVAAGDQRPQHEMVASTDCISGQYGDSELVHALGPSKGIRASGRGTVKQGIRKRFEVFEEMSSNGGLDSRKGSFSEETKSERAEIFLRYQAEKLQDRSKYKSVFYDRVGPEFEDTAARLGAMQVSDSDGEHQDDQSSVASASPGRNNRPPASKSTSPLKSSQSEQQLQLQKEQRGGELAGRLTSSGPSRTLWRNMPEVVEGGLLESLSKDEIKLKEAQFEIITSEASYYKNLLVLVDVFYNSSLFDHTRHNALVKALDKHHLFSNIVDIIECSASFLKALEEEWKKSPKMDWISQVIQDSIDSLKVYKDYCRNFFYQTKTLQKLCENAEFINQLSELEQRPDCRHITLQSYLEMPMKRVMSLQLLMDAVLRRMPLKAQNYNSSTLALGQLLTLARECDQESRMMSEKEQMLKLQNQLIFSKVKKVGCWGGDRHLIREAQVRVISATPNTQGFVAKMFLRKSYLQLHAFSDLLIVSKPKSDQGFQVLKHCPRAYVDAEYLSNPSCSTVEEFALSGGSNISPQKQTLRFRLVDTSDGTPPVILVLEMPSREEAERWLLIFSPRDELGDPVYEPVDCPQAEAIRAYAAQQKDDLELRLGDIVNIYKKTEDGWFLGSRLEQLGLRGWFPGNHVREIENEHYKAKLKKVSFRRKSAVAAYARHKP